MAWRSIPGDSRLGKTGAGRIGKILKKILNICAVRCMLCRRLSGYPENPEKMTKPSLRILRRPKPRNDLRQRHAKSGKSVAAFALRATPGSFVVGHSPGCPPCILYGEAHGIQFFYNDRPSQSGGQGGAAPAAHHVHRQLGADDPEIYRTEFRQLQGAERHRPLRESPQSA